MMDSDVVIIVSFHLAVALLLLTAGSSVTVSFGQQWTMNAIQTHFWAVRDYLAPVLRESKFKEHGRITPEEFVAAGDFLSYKFPTWSWSSGDSSKTREFLPKDKQYLVSRGVPCLRRVSQIESAALGKKKGGKGGTSNTETSDEQILNFADGGEGEGGDEEGWLATHLDNQAEEEIGEIADIPDSDPPPGVGSLTAGEEDNLANRVASTTLDGHGQDHATDPSHDAEGEEIGDIPDMDEDDEDALALGGMSAGVVEEDDPATARTAAAAATSTTAASSSAPGKDESNILSVRTYDCLITYDKYYQTPRMWLVGYDEHGSPLKPSQIFEDISSDYAQKTVTIEPFPHSASMSTASIHPCKHASVMKKVIERMDRGVREEQQRRLQSSGTSPAGEDGPGSTGNPAESPDGGDKSGTKKKKKWGLGGAIKKATRTTSGSNSGSGASGSPNQPSGATASTTGTGTGTGISAPAPEEAIEEEDGTTISDGAGGLRVDQYLLVFLKFMASIVPAIEIDATQSF